MINGVDACQAKQIVAECNVRLHSYGLRFDFKGGGKCGEYSIGIRAVETEGRSPLPMRRYTENMLRGLDGFENWVMDTAKEDAFRRHAKQHGYFPDYRTPELLHYWLKHIFPTILWIFRRQLCGQDLFSFRRSTEKGIDDATTD